MKHYDYEWITRDLNDSIVIMLVYVKENGEIKQYNSYQAVDVVDIVGNDVSVGMANVNDLSNLLLLGTMRFKGISNGEVLDISFSNLYKLYENANVISLDTGNIKMINRLLSLAELNAFTIIDGTLPGDNYKIIATVINKQSKELKRLIELARDYGVMSMDEKFAALKEINHINEFCVKRDKNLLNNQKIVL